MPTGIDRDEVQKLVSERSAQVVEVLPAEEYEWAHLPGAVSLPIKELTAETAARLDRERPVVVYCNDFTCDLSPRAARRLEQLGFPEVYDYVGGKMDWLSFDLPYEGQAVLAGGVVRRDVATARPGERVFELRSRLEGALAGMVVVLADGLVNGVVHPRDIESAPLDATAAEVMDAGVSTVRPSEDLAGLLERMAQANVRAITVTRSDGTLVGILDAEDVRASIHAAHLH